jgi:hypothetical protein
MRINSRKIQKILGSVWTAPKRIFKTFSTQEPLDASAECNTHNFYLIQKIKQGFFSYTIFPVKKINVGNFFLKL